MSIEGTMVIRVI